MSAKYSVKVNGVATLKGVAFLEALRYATAQIVRGVKPPVVEVYESKAKHRATLYVQHDEIVDMVLASDCIAVDAIAARGEGRENRPWTVIENGHRAQGYFDLTDVLREAFRLRERFGIACRVSVYTKPYGKKIYYFESNPAFGVYATPDFEILANEMGDVLACNMANGIDNKYSGIEASLPNE